MLGGWVMPRGGGGGGGGEVGLSRIYMLNAHLAALSGALGPKETSRTVGSGEPFCGLP